MAVGSIGCAVAAAVMAATTLMGCGTSRTSPNAKPRAATVSGQRVFEDRCAPCHGARGQGGPGTRLDSGAAARRFPNIDDEVAVVTNGASNGRMPAFGQALTPEEIRAVVAYTRTLP